MTSVSDVVKYRTVSITVYPWAHPSGREYFRFKRNDGKHTTRSTLAKAKKEALTHAQATYKGALDLDTLTPVQIASVKRMIEADPTCAMVDEFLVWHGRRRPKMRAHSAIAEFLAMKTSNQGLSLHNVNNLTRYLAKVPDMELSDIRPSDFPALTGGPRTRANVISAWITFFRWCVKREYLPHGEATAPERLDKPIVQRSIPDTYTPDELRTLLANVSPQYLPWLALAALAGLRTEEVIPQQGSRKSPLAWEDIDFLRKIIIVRPETAKTGHRRVIPICPALRSWLKPLAGAGTIGPHLYPGKPSTHGSLCETTRLGGFIGGWKRNALRHSFISYRVAQFGFSVTAVEAGNSEAVIKARYNDAKSKAEAKAWFGMAKCSSNVLTVD